MRIRTAMLGTAVAALLVLGIPLSAAAQTTGPQRITIVVQQDSSQDQPTFSRVVATGVINAIGTDVFLPSPPEDPASYSRYEFPDGTLSVRNTPVQQDFSLNPRSCVVKVEASGTWEVLEGTGAYLGAEGSGTLILSGRGFLAREAEGCSQTQGVFHAVIKITADVTLPG